MLFCTSSSMIRWLGDAMHTLETFTSLKRQQTNCCSVCCFRCHLSLCVYLSCCLVELPRAAEPSSSSGSGGRAERPPCSPVTQHSREQPSRPSQGGLGPGYGRVRDPARTCPEHRSHPGKETMHSPPPFLPYLHPWGWVPETTSPKSWWIEKEIVLPLLLFLLCKKSETARACCKTLLSLQGTFTCSLSLVCF